MAIDGKSKDILRALMNPSQPDAVPWSSRELCEILNHQMATDLASELDRFAEIEEWSHEKIRRTVDESGGGTFEEVLGASTPVEAVLRLVKDFAKASMREGGDLPKDVARVIYVLAILRGHACGARGISSLDLSILEREARRCLTSGWLPEKVAEDIRSLSLELTGSGDECKAAD